MVNLDKVIDTSVFLQDPICLTERAEPATPPANEIKLFAADVSGSTTLFKVKDSTGTVLTGMRDQTHVVRADQDLSRGDAVYISGATGNTPQVLKSDFYTESKMPAFGLMLEDTTNNSFGKVMIHGIVENVNTNGISANTTVYVGGDGGLTSIRPNFPEIEQVAGTVLVEGTGNGSVLVNLTDV